MLLSRREWLLSWGCAAPCLAQAPLGQGPLTQDWLRSIYWISYAPTNYQPPKPPPRASIRSDLQILRGAGFTGLVTYTASLPDIALEAKRLGFKALLLGVWDPANEQELLFAERTAADKFVAGLIIGNEGLMFRRYTQDALERAIRSLRATTGKPVSTTEVIESFYTKPELAAWSDFLTVNVHPYFHEKRVPTEGAEWTVAAWARLQQHLHGSKSVLFKEVGLPSAGGRGLSEAAQADYYRRLIGTDVCFSFFEAFDARFKQGAVEQSWGIFRADRSPKPAADVFSAFLRGRR